MSELKTLDLKALKGIHLKYMKKDFPPRELRPYFHMKALSRRDCYLCYGFYDGDRLLAYACLILQKSRTYALLDYFAVVEELRGQGIGSEFLRQLLPGIPVTNGLFVESEAVDSAKSAADLNTRQKRIEFYLQNGAQLTTTNCLLFGVDYRLLFFPKQEFSLTEEDLYDSLNKFYPEIYYNQFRYFYKLYQCHPIK